MSKLTYNCIMTLIYAVIKEILIFKFNNTSRANYYLQKTIKWRQFKAHNHKD